MQDELADLFGQKSAAQKGGSECLARMEPENALQLAKAQRLSKMFGDMLRLRIRLLVKA